MKTARTALMAIVFLIGISLICSPLFFWWENHDWTQMQVFKKYWPNFLIGILVVGLSQIINEPEKQ